jgi:hypothetical protein
MNGKTAKMLRRWSVAINSDPRDAKRLWKKTPRNKRPELRENIYTQLEPDNE